MNQSIRAAASVMGACAGLLGAAHGTFEVLQGNVPTGGIGISAIGAPCQRDAVWHACLPAMTLFPSFLTAGALTILFSAAALVWAMLLVRRKRGGPVLILLSILMLLAGGGIIPPLIGAIAGIGGTRINAPLTFWRTRLPGEVSRLMARLWPWPLAVFAGWELGGWLLGTFFNRAMIDLSIVLLFVFDLLMPVLAVLTGLARDASADRQPEPAPSAAKAHSR